MDFNKLTHKSQEAFTEAQNKAVSYGHVEVDGEHLLWALLDQPDGLDSTPGPSGRPLAHGARCKRLEMTVPRPLGVGPGLLEMSLDCAEVP